MVGSRCDGAGPWIGIVLVALAAVAAAAEPPLRDGDIVFQTSRSSQIVAIQQATRSPYSHMGVVFLRDGAPVVFEAVATVRYTPLGAWTARGERRRWVARRLRDADTVLDAAAVERLRRVARGFEGRPYDSPSIGQIAACTAPSSCGSSTTARSASVWARSRGSVTSI